MTLILWKAPAVDDPDEAAELLQPYYDCEDDSAFEPSGVLATVADELVRRFPDAEDGPWAEGPPFSTGRLLVIDIRWGADNAAIEAIEELAREHELVLYDPQGPDVHLPGDEEDSGPPEPTRPQDYLIFVLIGVAAVGVLWLGWWIDVPVIGWILMLVGGFGVSVVLFTAWILFSEPRKAAAEKRRSAER